MERDREGAELSLGDGGAVSRASAHRPPRFHFALLLRFSRHSAHAPTARSCRPTIAPLSAANQDRGHSAARPLGGRLLSWRGRKG